MSSIVSVVTDIKQRKIHRLYPKQINFISMLFFRKISRFEKYSIMRSHYQILFKCDLKPVFSFILWLIVSKEPLNQPRKYLRGLAGKPIMVKHLDYTHILKHLLYECFILLYRNDKLLMFL